MSSGKTAAAASKNGTPTADKPADGHSPTQVINFAALRHPSSSTALELVRKASEVIGEVDIDLVANPRGAVLWINPYLVNHKEGYSIRDLSDKDTIAEIYGYAEDIAKRGVQQPLQVWNEDGKLGVSVGTLRLYAVLYAIEHLDANIQAIPVILAEMHESKADRVANQIILNKNKPVSILEQASGIKMLIQFGWLPEQICATLSMQTARMESILLLSGADPVIIDMVRNNKVSAAFAMSTLKENPNRQKRALSILTKAAAKAAGGRRATKRTVTGPVSISRKQVRTIFRQPVVRQIKDDEIEVVFRTKPDNWAKIEEMLAGAEAEAAEA